jgi:hypothetical protein
VSSIYINPSKLLQMTNDWPVVGVLGSSLVIGVEPRRHINWQPVRLAGG